MLVSTSTWKISSKTCSAQKPQHKCKARPLPIIPPQSALRANVTHKPQPIHAAGQQPTNNAPCLRLALTKHITPPYLLTCICAYRSIPQTEPHSLIDNHMAHAQPAAHRLSRS